MTMNCDLLFSYDVVHKSYVYDDFVRNTKPSISDQKRFIRRLLLQDDNRQRVERAVTLAVSSANNNLSQPANISVHCILSDDDVLIKIINIGFFNLTDKEY